MLLIGYTDRFSARAGESLEVKVSSDFASDYSADLVRILSGDPNPAGPGMDLRAVPASFAGRYPSVAKPACPGSYGVLPLDANMLRATTTFTLRFQPRSLNKAPQTLCAFAAESMPLLAVCINADGLALEQAGTSATTPCAFESTGWYELRVVLAESWIHLRCMQIKNGTTVCQLDACGRGAYRQSTALVLAAAPVPHQAKRFTAFFNGRLESPRLLYGNVLADALELEYAATNLLASWDFSRDIGTRTLTDTGPRKLHGAVFNLPARGVRGSRWNGTEMCWRHAPEHYAAIHFHSDDLYDCGWETDFRFEIPPDLPSGIYGIRLRCKDCEDIIPVFVRPAQNAVKAKIAVLFSTMTYLAYANYPRTNFDTAFIEQRKAWCAYPHHPAEQPQFGRSLYDRHDDGSGVMFSSALRPQLLMRPGALAYLDAHGSGLRHFPADLHLIAWCAAKNLDIDVVTDHDLEAEGDAALNGYALVMTVTHPEYHTARTLDTIEGFVAQGGSLAYLGGNGFYWRVANSQAYPGAIEIRRGESGIRMWEAETGEFFHAFDGQYGGLWLKNDRPPQRLVGIGMSAQGAFTASYYRRTPTSYTPPYAWLFDGIEDDILGNFGLSGGGAAGFELDCTDQSLGTPPQAVVLARSEKHGADYACAPEKVWNPDEHLAAWQKAQIKAELTLVPKASGNFVFSTGSIMFCGSLPVNSFNNNISQLLANVVQRALDTHAGLHFNP